MTLTDWEVGRKAYLLSVLSPAQGQLNAVLFEMIIYSRPYVLLHATVSFNKVIYIFA